ncbi:MAG TPA: YicC family protein [Firmicutes bacterium]|nr:YicC family protein [Bacillota bacterium]
MIRSMTGYGCGMACRDGIRVTVEARSVNHRYSEISIRMPREFASLEERVRGLVRSRIERGHVDIVISVDSVDFVDGLEDVEDKEAGGDGDKDRGEKEGGGLGIRVKINEALARAYLNGARHLAAHLGIEADIDLGFLLTLPDILSCEKKAVDAELLWSSLMEPALDSAMDALVTMRTREGMRLYEDIIHRTEKIEQCIKRIGERAPQLAEEYRVRLERRVAELLGDLPVDPSRIAAEVVLFAERSSIAEELVRLGSHVKQIRDTMESGSERAVGVGRKLDFLLQEINRETNTIASKAPDLEISGCVVAIKSELEKIREQVQNIE